MPSVLRFTPVQTGYSSEEMPGTIVVPVEGGGSRKRQDILLTGHVVNCQWLLDAEEYTEFMGFFDTELRYGREDFLMDLITDIGVPTTHVCRTVGGNPKLTQQKNNAYWVSGTLECDKNPTFTSTITYSIGSGASWVFDGVNDRITMGDVLDKQGTSDAFSVSCFAAQDAIGNHLVTKYDASIDRGWRFYIDSEDKLDFSIEHDGDGFPIDRIMVQSTATGFADGVERQYGVTYDGSGDASGVTLFVNGVAISSAIETNGNTLTDTSLNSASFNIGGVNDIGSVGGGATTIKHVSIWNRELTAPEMDQVQGSGLSYPNLNGLSFAADLEAWWKIDGTDTTASGGVTDHSGNGFDGTAVNGLGAGGPGQGQIVFSQITKHFTAGDQVRVLNSAGIHPDGNVPLNLDGVYTVEAQAGGNAILLEDPSSVNTDWNTLFAIDPSAEYGNLANGNVTSTVTKVPS